MNSTLFFTDRMHLTDEGVALYVDALKLDRTSELPKQMVKHVENCPDCQLQIVELHEMMKNEVYDASMKHPYFDSTVQEPEVRYGIPFYRIAAAVAGVALIGTGYYFVSGNKPMQTEPVVVQKAEQTQKAESEAKTSQQQAVQQKEEKLLANNFAVSPNMEDLVQTQFRSVSVEVITPDIGEIVHQPITFKWKEISEPLTLKILSNKERTLITAQVITNTYTTQKFFAPGLYYWKLETKDDLLYAGKFLIK